MTECLALLFTDVVDSTRLHQQHGDAAMGPVWTAHDRAARALMRTWNGQEIGRSDGFLVLFRSAREALGFSLAYHRMLTELQVPMRARAGLHVGDVQLRQNSAADTAQGATVFDVEGAALPVAQRVMSAALGGQTLLTPAAVQALPAGEHRLQSHGHWRFKGLDEPIEVFEAGDPHTPFAPPQDAEKAYRVVRSGDGWAPVRELPHSLPAERDGFVGRLDALQALAQRLDQGARLVTVVGTGGVGKTRLVLRHAHAWRGEYPGGVWFCDLSPARSVDGIVHAVAQGMGVPLGVGDPVQQLAAAIGGRAHCLVILDNFEQVASHAEATLGVWLARAAGARFVVTSREVLNIAGESTLVLEPLQVVEAVQMFRERVRALGLHDRVLDQDADALGPLVELLDGLPLAIELAAPRVRLMPPRMLLARMHERFRLLAGAGQRENRQATLRATFDWSWDLLSPVERAGLAQLAVFDNGFSLPAAEAVVEIDGDVWVADVIQALVEKSWLRPLPDGRCGMLSAAQAYGRERLSGEAGSEALRVRQRHWTYFASFENADARTCLTDIDNVITASRQAAEAGEGVSALACLRAAWSCLKATGPYRTLRSLIDLVAACPLDAAGQAWLALVGADVNFWMGRPDEATRWLQSQTSPPDDAELCARLRGLRGHLQAQAGGFESAMRAYEEAMQFAEVSGNDALVIEITNARGAAAVGRGDITLALDCYREGLERARRSGNGIAEGGLLGNIGEVLLNQGELEPAGAHLEGALRLLAGGGHKRWEGNTRCNLGLLHHQLGAHAEAAEQFRAALNIARESGYARLEGTALCNLGITRLAAGRVAESVASHEAAVALAMRLRDPRVEGQFRTYLARALAATGDTASAVACLDVGETLLRASGDMLSVALLLCVRASLHMTLGATAAAQACRFEAERIGQAAHVAPASELAVALAETADELSRAA